MSTSANRRGLTGAAGLGVLTLFMSACSLGPSVTGVPTPSASPSTSAGAARSSTSLRLQTEWGSGQVGLGRGAVSCSRGGRSVTIGGTFGADTISVRLAGMRSGRRYVFLVGSKGVAASVAIVLAGPVTPAHAYVGPKHGVVGLGSGVLTVSRGGGSGWFTVQPSNPGIVQLTGRWSCAPDQKPVGAGLPVLNGASSPPVVGECWQQGQISVDGATTPVNCPNGEINIWAWPCACVTPGLGALQQLGRQATLEQVRGALCQMATEGDPVDVEVDAYQGVQTYYGWQFGLSPSAVVASNHC